jgi:hypothetical protein
MSSPLEQAGAVREPSEYATLTMDRHITGLWTQRSALRDADVPYLYGKFYSASRYDSLIDGLNREITARLTCARRSGTSQYNTNSFPAINSFYPYKRIVNGAEVVRVMADGQDGVIYDATAGQKTAIFTKSAGAGKARFQGVNQALYFTDGVENKKWLQPGPWQRNSPPSVISTIQNALVGAFSFIEIVFTAPPQLVVGDSVVITGLTTATQFNGAVRTVHSIIGSTVDFEPAFSTLPSYGPAADTGTATMFSGSAGATPQWVVGSTVIDTNGNLQYLGSYKVGTITSVQVTANTAVLTFSGANFAVTNGMSFTAAGLSGASFLNGKLLIATAVIPSGGNFIVTATFSKETLPYGPTADSGTASTGDVGTPATTGPATPSWGALPGAVTADGLSSWTNFGYPLFDWGPPAAPANAPTLSQITDLANDLGITFWQPLTNYAGLLPLYVLAPNGLVNCANSVSGGRSGISLPRFTASNWPNPNAPIQDGGVTWQASNWLGGGLIPAPWIKSTAVSAFGAMGGDALIDNNGNIQIAASGSGSTGAGSAPTWSTTYGGITTDASISWRCAGPYLPISFQGSKYAYAYHCIDGSVSSLSPLSVLSNGLLDGALVKGYGSGSNQVDAVWIFRTADGQPTPLFLAAVPNPGANILWSFVDQITDSLLNIAIPGPQGGVNNAPPAGMTAPVYYLGRMWAIFQNRVIYSGGPDTLTGNGNTSWPALKSFPMEEQPVRLVPLTVQNGGLLVIGTANTYIILGKGTASNPFTPPQKYMEGVGILNYDAVTLVGSTPHVFTGQSKFVSLDPGAGYAEAGFPIGDQFTSVTTGAGGKIPSGIATGALYAPSSTYVSFLENGSGDTAMYVADGAVGWFRLSPVTSPESGFVWSPRAAIVGGTSAVQAIETTPGIEQLLIGPPVGTPGPILFRDITVKQDWSAGAYHSFPSYDVKGNIVLCQSGEVAEIAHIGIKSAAVGARPEVGLLLGELAASTAVPFDWLERTSEDPPTLPPSKSMFSDRYTAMQNGVCPKCDNFQLAIDYGTQNAADETLLFSVYGAKHAERKQQ